MIALTENTGSPSEMVSRVVGLPVYEQSGPTGIRSISGPPPQWNSGGFNPYGSNLGYSLKFDHGTRPLFFGGVGFPTSGSNGVSAHTWACVFKHNITAYNRGNGTNFMYPILTSGGSGGSGIALQTVATGSVTGDKLFLIFTSANAQYAAPIPVELVQGRWYAVAIAQTAISSGNTTKTFYVYDLTNQKLHPLSGTTLVSNSLGYLPTADLYLGAYGQGITGNNLENRFIGEIAHAGIWTYAFSSTDFANYYADPWSCARGTYTASGSLTATQGRMNDATTSTVQITWGRTIGIGTGGGTGAPTYTCWRASSPSIVPGAGGSTQLAGGIISSTNGNTVVVNDTGLLPDTDYWYTLVSTDVQVLNSLPLYARTKKKRPLNIGVISDSKMQITSVPESICAAANGDNRYLSLINWSRGGAGLTTTNSASSWQIGNVIPASQQVVTLAYANGSVTGGTFNLIFPFATPLTVSGLAYNISASALQTAINAVLGAGSVTCAGGALPTAITITGAGGAYSNAPWVIPAYDLAGSALTGASPTQAGEPVYLSVTLTTAANPGTTANNLYSQFKTEAARFSPIDAVYIMQGANDTANAAWQTALSAMIADLLANVTSLVIVCPPEVRRTNANVPDASADATYYGFQSYLAAAVAANPGSIVANSSTYAMSVLAMTPDSLSDGVHESINTGFAAAVGFSRYLELSKTLDLTTPLVICS